LQFDAAIAAGEFEIRSADVLNGGKFLGGAQAGFLFESFPAAGVDLAPGEEGGFEALFDGVAQGKSVDGLLEPDAGGEFAAGA